jgi:uncharacterized short protein YbdD (DUF466 family)
MATVRRISGMPCYDEYVRHLQRCHPGHPIPTEAEFFDAYVAARSGADATRCC